MALYVKNPTWQDKPSTATPVNAAALNHQEDGILQASTDAIAALSALDDKVDSSTIAELIRDTIAAALVEGAGIDITVNDAGNTITIAASSVATPINEVEYNGTSWTSRPAISGVVKWLSTKDEDAPQPAMLAGDIWIQHPDALGS